MLGKWSLHDLILDIFLSHIIREVGHGGGGAVGHRRVGEEVAQQLVRDGGGDRNRDWYGCTGGCTSRVLFVATLWLSQRQQVFEGHPHEYCTVHIADKASGTKCYSMKR